MQQQPKTIEINLSPKILTKALSRARMLNMSLSRYIHTLVDRDIKKEKKDQWVPMPKYTQERLAKEIKEFEKELKEGKHKAYNSAEELIRDLES